MFEPLLIGLPLLTSFAVWIVMAKHPRLAWALATATPVVQAAMLLSLATPYHPPLLNMFMSITGLSAVLLFAIFIGLTIQCVYAKEVDQGDNFLILALLFNAGITIAILFIRQFALAGLISAAILILVVYAIRGQYTTAHAISSALRMLITTALASTAFLISVLLIDAYTATHELELIRIVAGVLAIAVGLLVAVFPFHLWQPRLSETVPPMVLTWVISFVAVSAIGTLLFTAETYPWLHSADSVAQTLRVLATLSAVITAFLALTSKSIDRVIVFANGSCLAIVLAGIATVSISGLAGATLSLATQILAIVLMMMVVGYSKLASESDVNPLHRLAGSTLWGFVIGAFAFAGIPPFGSFVGRWLIYQATAEDPIITIGLTLASAFILLAFLRLFLVRKPAPDQKLDQRRLSPARFSIGFVALMLVVVGIFPGPILTLIIDTLTKFPGLT